MDRKTSGWKDIHEFLEGRDDDGCVWWNVDMIGKKLISLRMSRKLTVAELAARVGIPVALMSAFEEGHRMPDSKTCLGLAAALGVGIERLFKGDEATFRDFRRRGGGDVSAPDQACIEVLALERLVDHVDVMDVLDLPVQAWRGPAGCPFPMATPDEAESVAVAVRTSWDLGSGPIRDMPGLLERHGVLVVEHEFTIEAFVATVDWELATDLRLVGIKASPFALRRRFSMAHELGHLIMGPTGAGDVEALADRFAAAFLLPAEVVRATVREGSMDEITRVRREYGVSIQSIALRCVDLGIFDRRWAADTMQRGKAHPDDSGGGWDGAPNTHEGRCAAAHRRGQIGASRYRELVGRWPDQGGLRAT